MKILLLALLIAITPITAFPTTSPNPIHSTLHLTPRAINIAAEWEKAWCKGSTLTHAMLKPESLAAAHITPARSPWDGDLSQAFRTWGYREIANHRSELCDFGAGGHELQRAFAELGIGTAAKVDGGPNECFHVEHKYADAVQRLPGGEWPQPGEQWYVVGGKRYRSTQAYTTLGLNIPAGSLYLLNRLSPLSAARESWNQPSIPRDSLPALAATSDHAWAFWNRAAAGNLANVKKIFVCMITNQVTLKLIEHALATYPLRPGEVRPRGVQRWPGTEWEGRFDAAQVLLGSPNGQAMGYFLAQHKHRLGNKVVEKVTVFRPDKGQMPYLLFWIGDADVDAADEGGKGREVARL